jgi:Alginate export
MMSMRMHTSLPLMLLLGASMLPNRAHAQANTQSNPAPSPPAADSDSSSWLFPIEKLDESLPSWLHIGGEYRDRLEGPVGIGYKGTNDFYLLDRFRLNVAIQPNDWLKFYGEVQDSRIFFNHHIANANPFEDSWTLWQGYVQVGSSTSGWADALAGRQVLLFGDERVIGPSNWLNVGRTFDVARVDLHHPGYEVAILGSSVVPGSNSFLHRAIPGNNFYGIYGSFKNIIPHATFEPYVLWRLAPGNFGLPETVGRGHLNEVTIGLHVKGTLPEEFDYDTEFDGQKGSLGPSSIGAWAGYVGLGKTLSKVSAAPRVFIEGNYASGKKNPGGLDWNTFDQLYPSNHDKYGFTDQVGRRNLVQFRVGVEENVGKKMEIQASV